MALFKYLHSVYKGCSIRRFKSHTNLSNNCMYEVMLRSLMAFVLFITMVIQHH